MENFMKKYSGLFPEKEVDKTLYVQYCEKVLLIGQYEADKWLKNEVEKIKEG